MLSISVPRSNIRTAIVPSGSRFLALSLCRYIRIIKEVKKVTILTIIILAASAIPLIGFTQVTGGAVSLITFALATNNLATNNLATNNIATNNIDEAITQNEEEREQAEAELEQSKQSEYAYLQEGLSLAEKLTALEGDLNSLIADIEQGKEDLAAREMDVEAKMKVIEQKQAEVESVSRALYKTSRMSLIETLLSSDGMTDMLRQFGFRRFGIAHLLDQARGYHGELANLTAEYNRLSSEIAALDIRLIELGEEVENLENQKIAYQQMAVAEAARQNALVGQIANITEEQEKLIAEKMAVAEDLGYDATPEGTIDNLPSPSYSPAYAFATRGFGHRVGFSQWGAYGRALDGMTYKDIAKSYYNNVLVTGGYKEPSQVCIIDKSCYSFEDYLRGVKEVYPEWGNTIEGYESLKAAAVVIRSFSIYYTGSDGVVRMGDSESYQVFNASAINDPSRENWYRAIRDTRGEVLTYEGRVIQAFHYAASGGFTRLPRDVDVWGQYATNRPEYTRIRDYNSSNTAYEGSELADSPYFFWVWYHNDPDPWMNSSELRGLLNASLLPGSYLDGPVLWRPDAGGMTDDQIVAELEKNSITPIGEFSSIDVINTTEGYSEKIVVATEEGTRNIDGMMFRTVFNRRSKGSLVIWTGFYDIITR